MHQPPAWVTEHLFDSIKDAAEETASFYLLSRPDNDGEHFYHTLEDEHGQVLHQLDSDDINDVVDYFKGDAEFIEHLAHIDE
jgi:hypothetical protein